MYIGEKLEASGVTRVWTYRFDTPDPVQLAAQPWEGVMHTSELYFLFDGELVKRVSEVVETEWMNG